jgi:hypothetical protein
MPVVFDEIRSLPEGIVAFRRNGRYALLSRDKLLSGKDTALQFAYDRVEPVRKGHLKVCADSTEIILNGQLETVLSVTGRVMPLGNGWATARHGAWQLFDEAGKAVADTTFDEGDGQRCLPGRPQGRLLGPVAPRHFAPASSLTTTR